MNRIATAIEKMRVQIESRIEAGLVTPEVVEKHRKSLDMPLNEFCMFQELKSGYMGTALSVEEAQTVYGYMGNTPATFNAQPCHVKVILTKLFAELLGKRIAA